jgi:hypothetical protein
VVEKLKSTVLATFVYGLVMIGAAQAQVIETTLFFDNFESADPVGTLLPDAPPVGEPWRLYVPTTLDGHIAANPGSNPRNTSSKVYHQLRPTTPTGGGVTTLIAPLSQASQNLILGNGNARVSFKYYETGPYGLSLIANTAPVGTVPTGFQATGVGFNSGYITYTGASPSPNSYNNLEWYDVKVDIDFTTKTYAVTVNDEVSPTVPFVSNTVETLTNIWLGNWASGADWYFDDLRVTTSGEVPPPGREWNIEGTGNWTNPLSWTPKFAPTDATAIAKFGSKITAPSTVMLDSAVTINGIEFNNANKYAVAGTGSITLDGTAPTIKGFAGDHEIQVAVQLEANTAVNVTAGSVSFNNQIDLAGNTLTTSGLVKINHSIINSLGGIGALASEGTLETQGSASIAGDLISTGVLDIDITNSGADIFQIAGAASLAGFIDVSLADGFVPATSYTILTAAEGITLTAPLQITGSAASLFRSVSIIGNSLVLSSVPEPASALMLALGTVISLQVRRRHKRTNG